MRARIDINEVEMRTKIRAKYLRAMENEEWGLLPGEVYVKSFLRTYAEFLGLDSRQLLDEYRRRFEHASDHDLRPLAPLGRERDRRARRSRSVPPWAVIAAAVVAIVAVLEVVGLHSGPSASSSRQSTSSSTTSAAATSHRHHHASPAATGSTTTPSRPAAPRTVKLQLTPTGAVYVCVENGSGRPLIPGIIYDTGQTIPVVRARKLLLTLGNASVLMKVNGVPVTVPSTGRPVGYELVPGSAPVPLGPASQPQCT